MSKLEKIAESFSDEERVNFFTEYCTIALMPYMVAAAIAISYAPPNGDGINYKHIEAVKREAEKQYFLQTCLI